MKKVTLIIAVLILCSCTKKTECNIGLIPGSIIDLTKSNGDFIFTNQKGEIDTLVLVEFYNKLSRHTIKSLSNYKECGQVIGYDYASAKGKGTIGIRLEKNKDPKYFLSINGLCISNDFYLSENEIQNDSVLKIEIQKCSESKYKEFGFKNLKIEYFVTQNNDVWKPIKFIPR